MNTLIAFLGFFVGVLMGAGFYVVNWFYALNGFLWKSGKGLISVFVALQIYILIRSFFIKTDRVSLKGFFKLGFQVGFILVMILSSLCGALLVTLVR